MEPPLYHPKMRQPSSRARPAKIPPPRDLRSITLLFYITNSKPPAFVKSGTSLALTLTRQSEEVVPNMKENEHGNDDGFDDG